MEHAHLNAIGTGGAVASPKCIKSLHSRFGTIVTSRYKSHRTSGWWSTVASAIRTVAVISHEVPRKWSITEYQIQTLNSDSLQILCFSIATSLAAPVAPFLPYTSPYYAPAPLKYTAPLVHHAAPIYSAPYAHHPAPYALPYHAAPVVKAVAAPLAQSYTSFSQVVTHPQPIVKVHAEPVHYPVHYDPAPLKYTAPLIRAPYAAYTHHYWNSRTRHIHPHLLVRLIPSESNKLNPIVHIVLFKTFNKANQENINKNLYSSSE